jgi:hypothetical protein
VSFTHFSPPFLAGLPHSAYRYFTAASRTVVMFRMVACCSIVVASVEGAHAHWSKADTSKFMDDCISSCRANPHVPVSRHGQCAAYCTCSSGLMEKVYPDYAAVNAVTTKEPQSPVLHRAYEIFDFCYRRGFRVN